VLITGVTGFAGSHLTEYLLARLVAILDTTVISRILVLDTQSQRIHLAVLSRFQGVL